MKTPSIKTLCNRGYTPETAKQIRKILDRYNERYPRSWDRPAPTRTLEEVSALLGGFGVEQIPRGTNKQSPAITYVNMGDTYAETILFHSGNFHCGAWGDIVERGNYA